VVDGVVRGHSRSSAMSRHSIEHIYDFLIDFNRNQASFFYRLRAIASYLSKVANFNLPHLHLAPPMGGAFEFCRDLWRQKTIVPGLSCGVVCVVIYL